MDFTSVDFTVYSKKLPGFPTLPEPVRISVMAINLYPFLLPSQSLNTDSPLKGPKVENGETKVKEKKVLKKVTRAARWGHFFFWT